MWTVTLPLLSGEDVMIFRELQIHSTVTLLSIGTSSGVVFKSYGFVDVNSIVFNSKLSKNPMKTRK